MFFLSDQNDYYDSPMVSVTVTLLLPPFTLGVVYIFLCIITWKVTQSK